MSHKIVHLWHAEKFTRDFLNFMEMHFPSEDHVFYVYGETAKFNVPTDVKNIVLLESNRSWIQMVADLHRTDKILLHGVTTDRDFLLLLFFMPWVLGKCYWIIWGSDLYRFLDTPAQNTLKQKIKYKFKTFAKHVIYKRFGHIVTYLEGDAELARKWYGWNGKYHECIMYPSNLYKEIEVSAQKTDEVCLLIGHSAVPFNNHDEIFEKLKPFRNRNIKIYCPLSYGILDVRDEYRDSIIEKGNELFGDKFIPLTDFMPFDEYLKILAEVDIGVFAFRRQMAMGNIISLLSLGKKVYLHEDNTPYKFFKEKGIEIYNLKEFDLAPIDEATKSKNSQLIKDYFSPENLKKQLNAIFTG
jgi:hypothetical protein